MTQQEAIRKALGCLKLANSSNANEAALAAAKAQEIIDRYQLDISSAEYDSQEDARDKEPITDFGYSDPLESMKYNWACWIRLTRCVAIANSCRTVMLHQERGSIIKIIGRPSDVSAARYLYGYFKAEVNRLLEEYCKGHGRQWAGQFALGVVDAISEKLSSQREATFQTMRKEQGNNPLALVKLNTAIAKMEKRGQDVSAWMNSNLNLCRGRSVGGTATHEGMSARSQGRKAGESIRVSRAKGSIGAGVAQIRG
jgi:hypothetical protein